MACKQIIRGAKSAKANYSPRNRNYRIFLLTCWLEEEDDDCPANWRFRLEEPRSGLRRGCVGIERLVALLNDEIAGRLVISIDSTKQGDDDNGSESS
ncbi:MAG: hypothetical protein AAF702_43640 [Chloroflexota bacterium]